MSKAAARENIALAALSKRISRMEADLSVSLLERNSKGVKLTSAGYTFLQHALGILSAVDRLGSELRDYSHGIRGYVRIAANTSVVINYLFDDLRDFMQENPSVAIDVQERLSVRVVKALTDGVVDIGIYSGNIPSDNLSVFPYRSDTLVIVTPRQHPLAGRRSIRLEEALEFDFIGLEEWSAIHTLIAREATAQGRPLRVRGQVHSFEAMCRLIESSIGIGILPKRAAMPYMRRMGLAMSPLDEKWGHREIVIGVRNPDALTPSALQVLTHLRACCA